MSLFVFGAHFSNVVCLRVCSGAIFNGQVAIMYTYYSVYTRIYHSIHTLHLLFYIDNRSRIIYRHKLHLSFHICRIFF